MPRGKKIDTWIFKHDGIEIKVPVIMNRGRYDITFEVKNEEYDLHFIDSDATKLKETFSKAFYSRARVEWKPYLRVCVGGKTERLNNTTHRDEPYVKENIKCGLKLYVERLEVGINNAGEPIHRPASNYGESRRITKEMPEIGPVDTSWWHYDSGGDGIAALIPDTPENRAAIDLISSAMEELADRLKMLLGQDQIDQTLTLIGRREIKLLSSGTEVSN